MSHWGRWIIVAFVILGAAGCARDLPPSPARPAGSTGPGPASVSGPAAEVRPRAALQPAVPLRVSSFPSTSWAGIFIAVERGYFRDEGLDVELVNAGPLQQQVSLLSTDKLEVGAGGVNLGLFNAMARGVEMKLVADKGSGGTTVAVARRDLVDAGRLKNYSDLKGLKIAIGSTGSLQEAALEKMLAQGGISLKDVDLQYLEQTIMATALANGSIDLALSIEPYPTILESQGVGVRWRKTDEFLPGLQEAVLAYSASLMRDNPAAAERFMIAYLRGVRDYNRAFFGVKDPRERAAISEILMKQTSVKDAAIFDKMSPVVINPDGYLDMKGLREEVAYFTGRGQLPVDAFRIEALVENSYVDKAVKELGPYKP